jgi:hypothetical protein
MDVMSPQNKSTPPLAISSLQTISQGPAIPCQLERQLNTIENFGMGSLEALDLLELNEKFRPN